MDFLKAEIANKRKAIQEGSSRPSKYMRRGEVERLKEEEQAKLQRKPAEAPLSSATVVWSPSNLTRSPRPNPSCSSESRIPHQLPELLAREVQAPNLKLPQHLQQSLNNSTYRTKMLSDAYGPRASPFVCLLSQIETVDCAFVLLSSSKSGEETSRVVA